MKLGFRFRDRTIKLRRIGSTTSKQKYQFGDDKRLSDWITTQRTDLKYNNRRVYQKQEHKQISRGCI